MDELRQGFSVPFSFSVHFTRDVWERGNRVFVDAIRRLEPNRRHRVLVVLDSHVAAAHLSLSSDIEAYFSAHADVLQLAAPPLIVPGGEAVKNDLTHQL